MVCVEMVRHQFGLLRGRDNCVVCVERARQLCGLC